MAAQTAPPRGGFAPGAEPSTVSKKLVAGRIEPGRRLSGGTGGGPVAGNVARFSFSRTKPPSLDFRPLLR